MCSKISDQSSIKVQPWGSINGKDVEKFTLRNKFDQEISVINYGATITNIKTPDKNNQLADIVLGFDNIEGNSKLYCKFNTFYCFFFQNIFLNVI